MISSVFRDDFAPAFQGTREVKGLLRGPTEQVSGRPLVSALTKTRSTKPYSRHISKPKFAHRTTQGL